MDHSSCASLLMDTIAQNPNFNRLVAMTERYLDALKVLLRSQDLEIDLV